jgi:Trk-type K+ transport system membrane component
MPYDLIPPGYSAVLIGQAAAIEELGTFAPLEQDSAEGALFLVRLDFTEFPSAEALDQLEQAFFDAGVELWPGYNHVVYADVDQPGIYLAWQKGLAWIPIIVGLLVTVVLPPLLGGLIWKLLPQSLKDLISGIVNMGIMVLVMFLMTKMMPKPTPEKEKPKKVKEAKPAQLEESKT